MTTDPRPRRRALRRAAAGLFLGLWVATALPTFAKVDEPGRADHSARTDRGDRGHRIERLVRALDLDAAQTTKLRELASDLRRRVEPLRQERRDLRDQLADELDSTAPDPERIGRLLLSLRAEREKGRAALTALDQGLEKILRPDQLGRYQVIRALRPFLADRRGCRRDADLGR